MATQLRILHCFRAPVGGLFRHVRDLVVAQAEMGHHVAVACDSRTGGPDSDKHLQPVKDACELGLWRIPMSRGLGPLDFFAYRRIYRLSSRRIGAHIIHGHGAKGGAYARLAANSIKNKGLLTRAVYTPHGGSLHYSRSSFLGRLYLDAERRLAPMTDGLIFESAYSAGLYALKVAEPACPARIIPNGLQPQDFYEIHLADEAADFLFVGELRRLKGVDVLLHAMARLVRRFRVRAVIVGEGPEEAALRRLASRLGLDKCVQFTGALPTRQAFVRGRCLVVPSRAESFPYIVLEGAAAQLPMILSNVGGIPEIIEGTTMHAVPAGDVKALAEEMQAFLETPSIFMEQAQKLRAIVSERYTVARMAGAIDDFYRELLGA